MTSQDLGQLLIDLGFAEEAEVVAAKALSQGIPFTDLKTVRIDPAALALVPRQIAEKYSVLPLKLEGMNLWLAMAQVNGIRALDEVRKVSGCRVIPVMVVPGAIDEVISKYY